MKNNVLLTFLFVLFGYVANAKPGTDHYVQIGKDTSTNSAEKADSILFLKGLKDKSQSDPIQIRRDTLKIISADRFFYYPLGKFNKLTVLKDKFKALNYRKEVEPDQTDPTSKATVHRFYTANNFLKYFYQTETGKYEIVSGKITDNSLTLLNGIKIGMSKKDLLDLYFTGGVQQAAEKINVVEFISALDGIWHYYTFTGNKLTEIYFDTDYLLNKK